MCLKKALYELRKLENDFLENDLKGEVRRLLEEFLGRPSLYRYYSRSSPGSSGPIYFSPLALLSSEDKPGPVGPAGPPRRHGRPGPPGLSASTEQPQPTTTQLPEYSTSVPTSTETDQATITATS